MENEPLSLKENIYRFISHRQTVSWVELQSLGKGDWVLESPLNNNVIIAFGLSDEVSLAVKELIQEGRIDILPTSLLVYVADGCIPNLPIPKTMKAMLTTKKESWIPVTFSTSEYVINVIKNNKKLTKKDKEKIISKIMSKPHFIKTLNKEGSSQ